MVKCQPSLPTGPQCKVTGSTSTTSFKPVETQVGSEVLTGERVAVYVLHMELAQRRAGLWELGLLVGERQEGCLS